MDRLHEYGICNYDIISKNERKGRYCLCFCNENYDKSSSWLSAPENEMCMLKWNSKENEADYETLVKEMEIYERLAETDITPKLFAKDPYFVMKYEKDCKTFRNYLLEGPSEESFEVALKSVLDKYAKMLELLNNKTKLEFDSLPPLKQQIRRFHSKLLLSGPEGTKENTKEKTINKIYKYWFWAINRINENDYSTKSYAIHGDFHLNNELVNTECNVFLIDFENVVYGNPNVELAYWYTQAWMLVSAKEEYVRILDEHITILLDIEFFDKKSFWMIVELFKKAIARNSRFKKVEVR